MIPFCYLFAEYHTWHLTLHFQLGSLVVECQPAVQKVVASNPGWGPKKWKKIDFHQQKLSSLLIACDMKLDIVLCSVFYAKASKIQWTFLN